MSRAAGDLEEPGPRGVRVRRRKARPFWGAAVSAVGVLASLIGCVPKEWSPSPDDLTLTAPGYISVVQTAPERREGRITFEPVATGVKVTVDNRGGFFSEDTASSAGAPVVLATARAGRFFKSVGMTIEGGRPAREVSKIHKRVDVYLPLRGRVLRAAWGERGEPYDPEPLAALATKLASRLSALAEMNR